MTHTTINKHTWCVYILQASDGKYYTGITNNMVARWQKHHNKTGAKFFRGRIPIALCFQEPEHTRSSASKREYQIKQLNKNQKQQLILQHYGPHLPAA
jgi:putative endonuclease